MTRATRRLAHASAFLVGGLIALALAGCGSSPSVELPISVKGGPSPSAASDAPRQLFTGDPLADLINLPIWDQLTNDATLTLARIAEWQAATPPKIDPVNAALAAGCPNAVLIGTKDLRLKLGMLRDKVNALKARVTSIGAGDDGGPTLLLDITTRQFGPQATGGFSIDGLKEEVRSRLQLVTTGCAPLGLKVLTKINDLAVQAGIGAVIPGAGALPGLLRGLGQ